MVAPRRSALDASLAGRGPAREVDERRVIESAPNSEPHPRAPSEAQIDALTRFVRASERLLVLTGAGCSTESGIPDYRDAAGEWKRTAPIQYQAFMGQESARRRYWARSMLGWAPIRDARPSASHRALATLEQLERTHHLVTQNVDGLHQKAGSVKVIDLHGRLDVVECIECARRLDRHTMQAVLEALNPAWRPREVRIAPDGDADLDEAASASFEIPDCSGCGGILKPTVVFFGESVPRERVAAAYRRLTESDALLVAGSSLMVFSGYRFVREATRRGCPVAIVNLGRTRADDEVTLKAEAGCGAALEAVVSRL